jgi:hypothetical protein
MENNKETILRYIKTLQNQIKFKDNTISRLEKENEYIKDIINSDYKRYKMIIAMLSILLMVSSGMCIYHLLL